MKKWNIKALITNLREESATLKRLIRVSQNKAPPEVECYFHQMEKQSRELATMLHKSESGTLPLTVALVGEFNAGKSSFINHLLRDGSICPQDVKPTTSVVTMFMYGAKEKITMHSSGNKRRGISRAEYSRRVQEQHQNASQGQTMRFTFEMPVTALKGLNLLDTPGFNNPKNCNDGKVTERIMAESDAFFYLVDVNEGEIPHSESNTLERIKSEAPESAILLVISKADTKSPQAVEKIKSILHTQYGSLFNTLILTYSTKVERNDINTRREITAMLADLRKHATARNRASLVRAVQQHYDRRLSEGSEIHAALDIKVAESESEAVLRGELLEKVILKYHKLVHLVYEQFVSELNDALDDALNVEEVPNSGWFWNDGRVVYKKDKLIKRVRSSDIFDNAEEIINRTFRSLLGDDVRCKPNVINSIRTSCASAAHKSVKLLTSVGGQFGSVKEAAGHLEIDIEEEREAIVEAAWTPLLDAFDRTEKDIRGQYGERTRAVRNDAAKLARAAKALCQVHEQGIKLLT